MPSMFRMTVAVVMWVNIRLDVVVVVAVLSEGGKPWKRPQRPRTGQHPTGPYRSLVLILYPSAWCTQPSSHLRAR
ncbi:hypothetical protein BDV40DRAFT_281966 [Aspergillus tamarii]|uniref:Secreted protein n=1 Tax=Aspergillus tamarii TaxID=41984 RepID=A0A5N6UC78_ASPTM|nr:hypothetical protein BDV40DRAFT_281966 [Aspergillus tamarii]